MKKNETKAMKTGRGKSIAIALCGVAVIALIGVFTFPKTEGKSDTLVKADWEKIKKENAKATTGDDIVMPEKKELKEDVSVEEKTEPEQEEAVEETTSGGLELWFDENSTLDWPASGPVLMDYSMDKTIYFPTLEQYQYNPALMIRGEVGERIQAAQEGVIASIGKDAKTGTTVTVDMGNGYQAVYGQLKDVMVENGMYVNKGQMLGYLSEPTKYYSIEGPHLYFEILKDGIPTNPKAFIPTEAS